LKIRLKAERYDTCYLLTLKVISHKVKALYNVFYTLSTLCICIYTLNVLYISKKSSEFLPTYVLNSRPCSPNKLGSVLTIFWQLLSRYGVRGCINGPNLRFFTSFKDCTLSDLNFSRQNQSPRATGRKGMFVARKLILDFRFGRVSGAEDVYFYVSDKEK
jgi:hypothetical protein